MVAAILVRRALVNRSGVSGDTRSEWRLTMKNLMGILVMGTLVYTAPAPVAWAGSAEAPCVQDDAQPGVDPQPCSILTRLPGCANFPEFASAVAAAATGVFLPAGRTRPCGTRNIRGWAVTNGVATSFHITAPATECPITFTCIDAAGGQVVGTASATLELDDKVDGVTFNCAGAQIEADCGEGGRTCRWNWTVNKT
jgi:hypothetical protein